MQKQILTSIIFLLITTFYLFSLYPKQQRQQNNSLKVCLIAEGNSAYTQIDKYFGPRNYECPDEIHPQKAPHITIDSGLFLFHLHRDIDNDPVTKKTDRQRNEIKIGPGSPDDLKAKDGQTWKYSWKFKLDKNFQGSSKFTHLHQIKSDENNSDPYITITASVANVYAKPYFGQWLEAQEIIKFGPQGSVFFTLTAESGKVLMNYNDPRKIEGGTYMRPKWGIYRSLEDKAVLRDETVQFANICLERLS